MSGFGHFLGFVDGLAGGSKRLDVSWTNTSSVADLTVTDLASGDNTVTVPGSVVGVVIVPPTSNTAALKLKGAAGDTGVQISKTRPTVVAWQTGTSFILNAGAAVTGCQFWFF